MPRTMDTRKLLRTLLWLALLVGLSSGKDVANDVDDDTRVIEETSHGIKTYKDLQDYYAAQYADIGKLYWGGYIPKPVREQLWPVDDGDRSANELFWQKFVPKPVRDQLWPEDDIEDVEDRTEEEEDEDNVVESRAVGSEDKEFKKKQKDKEKKKDKDKEKKKGKEERKEKGDGRDEDERKKDKEERKREREIEQEERRKEKERQKEERQREKEERKREKEIEREERKMEREERREERKKEREEKRKEREERQKARQEACDEKLPGSRPIRNINPCKVVCVRIEQIWRPEIKSYPFGDGERCFFNRVCQNGRCVRPKPTTPAVITTEAASTPDEGSTESGTSIAPPEGTTEESGIQTEDYATTDSEDASTRSPTEGDETTPASDVTTGASTEKEVTTDESREADATTAEATEEEATTGASREADATTAEVTEKETTTGASREADVTTDRPTDVSEDATDAADDGDTTTDRSREEVDRIQGKRIYEPTEHGEVAETTRFQRVIEDEHATENREESEDKTEPPALEKLRPYTRPTGFKENEATEFGRVTPGFLPSFTSEDSQANEIRLEGLQTQRPWGFREPRLITGVPLTPKRIHIPLEREVFGHLEESTRRPVRTFTTDTDAGYETSPTEIKHFTRHDEPYEAYNP